jgi:hypothetical protein
MEDTFEKAEMPVTGNGNPSLDADPIDEDTEKSIDAALDEAFSETETPEAEEIPDVVEKSQQDELSEQETTQPEPIPVPEPVQPVQPEAEIDPEIGKIEPPRNLSEKNQSNWRKLQETASVYKKQAQEAESLRQKLVEYEQKPPAPPDYDELRKFRAVFDIQSDPDFQNKYDVPINQAKANIYGIMKQHGASDELLQSIEAQGGPDKVDQKWWLSTLGKLPMTDAERVKRNIVDVADLSEKRVGEIMNSAQNAEQYYSSRDEALVERFTKQEEESINYIQEKIKEQNADWALQKEIPAGATPEQRKAIESQNAQAAQLEQLFMGAMYPQTPQQRADVAAAAAMSHMLTNQLRTEQTARQKMDAQIKQLTEENNRLKGAGRMPRQNLATASSNKPASVSDRLKMSSADAIDMGLDEAGN